MKIDTKSCTQVGLTFDNEHGPMQYLDINSNVSVVGIVVCRDHC